eukprot:m.19858 g.19858  ORF g.19858 m.19858 type:complete len:829 (+) comp6693_c0_seq1:210-2696(+)
MAAARGSPQTAMMQQQDAMLGNKHAEPGFSRLLLEMPDTSFIGGANKTAGRLGGERVHTTFSQTLQQVQELQSRVSRTIDTARADDDARLLHAQHMDMDQFGNSLKAIQLSQTLGGPRRVAPTNIEGFLKQERQRALTRAVQETMEQTHREYQKRHFAQMKADWEAEKDILRQMLNNMSAVAPQEPDQYKPSTSSDVSVMLPVHGYGMEADAARFAEAVKIFVEKNLCLHEDIPILELLKSAAEKMDDKSNKDQIVDCLEVIRCMCTQANPNTGNTSEYPRHHGFKSMDSEARNDHILQASKSFLERSFWEEISRELSGVGGFLKWYQQNLQSMNEDAKWEGVYNCLRAGRLRDAEEAALQLDEEHHRQSVIAGINSLNHPHKFTKHQIVLDRTAGHFKRVVCSVLKLSDTGGEEHSFTDTWDWLWYQLSIVRTKDSEARKESFLTLQALIWRNGDGEGYFGHTMAYCQLLLLTGQFERAIHVLRGFSLMHAVHFAIGLEHYGLLKICTNYTDPLFNPHEDVFNFGQLVQGYARPLQKSFPEVALSYYFILRQLPAPREDVTGRNVGLFLFCVADMLLETRMWTGILGRYENGEKSRAMIDRFERALRDENGERVALHPVISYVAQVTSSKGQMFDAIQLYDLANEKVEVIRHVVQALSQDPGMSRADSGIRKVRDFADSIMSDSRYRQAEMTRSKDLETLSVVLTLDTFFEKCREGLSQEALVCLERSPDTRKYIPVDIDSVEDCTQEFDDMPEEIRKLLPNVLLYSMVAITQEYKVKATQRYRDESGLQHLRNRGRALTLYSGRIKYRLPGDTGAKLVRMEVALQG